MVIQFKVHGSGKDLYGDGMAIWYARDRMVDGPIFGSADYFHGLAVIIDTYSNHNGEHNHQHPYISAMVNNGTLHYDHDRDGTHTQLAGCEVKLRNLYYDTNILIRYERETLTVMTDLDNKADWKDCLSVSGVHLPTGYYFGVSAATGDLSDAHDIMSIRLLELDTPDATVEDRSNIVPSAERFEAPRESFVYSNRVSSDSGYGAIAEEPHYVPVHVDENYVHVPYLNNTSLADNKLFQL
ncbi:hypothetical protein AAG570_009643 [Ranatra chinensis]|uniref:L-type lectin-like domain-containing protein n=1 Tax=Ranatra chinensis TaxID=642074 RepID=A0ABD0ZAS7_9HEMI